VGLLLRQGESLSELGLLADRMRSLCRTGTASGRPHCNSMTKLMLGRFLLLAVAFAATSAQASQWTTLQDTRFGYSYSYPAEMFAPTEGQRPSFYYFGSNETDAKFLVGAWNNKEGATPQEFKQWMLTHAEGYEDIPYQPRGRSWFVLSAHRGDQIYYEKAIFSCSGRVVNVIAIAYPEAERQRFDQVVERMEDSFKSGRGCG
jgi:hypothetical protein